MKRWCTLAIVVGLLVIAGPALATADQPEVNPLLAEFDTPFGVPPFPEIENRHYSTALKEAMERHREQIEVIAEAEEAPTFENTVEALDRSGALLRQITRILFHMIGANTNDELQVIAKEVAPLLSRHQDDILLNEKLFRRVEAVYEQRDQLQLTPEQRRLLEESYKGFVRQGARLEEEQKAVLRSINEELSVLSLQFGENVLEENNTFELVIERREDLAGLPDPVVAGAAEAAKERGHEGKWVFTLHKPSMIPFLQYSDRRELRERIFTAYTNRGNHDNELDNKAIAAKIAALRSRRAKLLGYETHAHLVLERNMAKTPEAVYEFLDQLWKPALAVAKREAAALQALIEEEGNDFGLQPWDWWYYAEKLRKARYDLDDEALRPYFELERVRAGAFDVASKLYGISFRERSDVPTYHEDVRVVEVTEADGSHIGILYVDYFPRASKQGGAWSGAYRAQLRLDGKRVAPVIGNVGNFSKPVGDKPALLSVEEVKTLFHEFGHALHGLLSDTTYEGLSGTSVPRDFVELPSQIMENWATQPEVLKMYAKHFETGEPMPDDLIDRIEKASLFNQGFETVEYLAAAFLDMDWHTLSDDQERDVLELEASSLKRIGLIPEIVVRYRTPYFGHIFGDGYSAGYYSYIWAEVLDADAFEAFKERGLFDRKTAQSFRENILARGGSEDPMVLYKRFRGAEPRMEPLLRRRGLTAGGE